jgi:membrane protein implicated in regulation of membrane protease activity
MLLLFAILLLIFVPWPWNLIAFVALLILAAGEVRFWWGRVKGRRLEAGAETLIGSRARVVSDCRPVGEVALQGAIWKARCSPGADSEQAVTVVGRDGLLLIVEPDARTV